MNSSSLQPNIYSIQKDVTNLLSEISDVFQNVELIATSEKLSKEDREPILDFLKQSKLDIDNAKKNVGGC